MINIERIQKIATALGELNEQVVYVGGAVVELYIENPELADVRPTMDIDCVTQLSSRNEFWKFEEQLRKKGFSNDQTPGAPICRWTFGEEIVDIMPDNPSILGFSNRWYHQAMASSVIRRLPNGIQIRIFDDVFFIATKIEAILGRGGNDWRMSHDFEDLICILNYSNDLVLKVKQSQTNVMIYLQERFYEMLHRSNIREEVESALPYEESDRTDFILELMKTIVEI